MLYVVDINGDRVVYDTSSDKIWYPYLSHTFNKTLSEQLDWIADLNVDEYAGITDWRIAYYEDMMGLRISMFGSLKPATINSVYNFNSNIYFPYTSEGPGMGGVGINYYTHGRTGNENGLETGAIINANPGGVGGLPTSQRYIDEGIQVGPPYGPGQYYTLDPTEAQDHWIELGPNTYIYNDDLNYTPDDEPYAIQDGHRACGAWTVSESCLSIAPVAVDIKPRSCPNPISNKDKGVLPVAIVGMEDFDVTQVDPASVLLDGVSPLRWSYEDVTAPHEPSDMDAYDCTEAGPDGYLDLTLKFDVQEVADLVLDIDEMTDGAVVKLGLTGSLQGVEEYFYGKDVVVILKKGK